MFTANEVLMMGSLQHSAEAASAAALSELEAKLEAAWGPEKIPLQKELPAAQIKAKEGKQFVTLQAFPTRDPKTNITNIEVLAFQASEQCCEWTAAGHFHQSKTKA